mgnify:CR=1 FL=1
MPQCHASLPPSPWILCWQRLIPPDGPILDVACGSGRHSRLFLAAGREVCAIDRDAGALDDLRTHPSAETVVADLEDGTPWPLPDRRFAAVIVTNYLHRPLFPHLLAALEPGGVLLYETFAVGHERLGRPSNPDFLLRDGELLDVVRGRLRTVAYEAVELTEPERIVQRIAAVRPRR